MFQFGLNMFQYLFQPFNMTYRCFSVSMIPGIEREDVERGGKIIMPASALDQLTRLNIEYPMLFKLTNKNMNRVTHCGVLEFVADEGNVYLPHWMMTNLVLEEGNLIQIESVSLPLATFSRLQPLSEDFLHIKDLKAVLENDLRKFACLTTGDVIAISYNSKVYELNVLETKPGEAVKIIECDLNYELVPPVGCKEDEHMSVAGSCGTEPVEEDTTMAEPSGFSPFSGEGVRLDGKKKKPNQEMLPPLTQQQTLVRGVPDHEYVIGSLKFLRNAKPPSSSNNRDDSPEAFEAFKGEGFTLRSVKPKA